MTIPVDIKNDPWAWYYRLFVIWVSTVFVLIGTAVTFGPERWRTAPSLNQVRDYVFPFWHMPWLVWGIMFVGTGFAVAFDRWRVAGYVSAAGICSLFIGFSVIYSLVAPTAVTAPPARAPGMPYLGTTNVITIGLSALAPLAMLAGIRFSVVVAKRRRVVP